MGRYPVNAWQTLSDMLFICHALGLLLVNSMCTWVIVINLYHGRQYCHASYISPWQSLANVGKCMFKDLIMTYRKKLWYWRYKGAMRISHWHIRVAPECLPSHNAWYIIHKTDNDMNEFISTHYEAKIQEKKFWSMWQHYVHCRNLGMVLQVICMATLMWWCQSR